VRCVQLEASTSVLDKERGMTVTFPQMPYAFKNAVFVLVGEEFSVKYGGRKSKLVMGSTSLRP